MLTRWPGGFPILGHDYGAWRLERSIKLVKTEPFAEIDSQRNNNHDINMKKKFW